ncbi:MAG: kbl, partial [Acidimicrobiaceae bacterium]|nr:kbl [Acidimicrobiaceae bacterium]
ETRAAGRYKVLRPLMGPIGPVAHLEGREVIVLCSNDYLGLAAHPEVVEAGARALYEYGAGTASVRFICGTLDIHARLEAALAELVGTEATLSFVSCWNANEALFPTVVAPGDTIISDSLNHASIIDSVRQVRGAERTVFAHGDLGALADALERAPAGGVSWVVTDGVFSMEGDAAPLPEIGALCRSHGAVLVVDDSHGLGVLGATGRGTAEHFSMLGQLDVVTGTLGKALGGAAGGFVAGPARLIELLTQRARPSLFSNALPATVAGSAGKAVEILLREPERVERTRRNAERLRRGLSALGFQVEEAPSAIVPIILGEATEVERCSARLLELGVLVVGFSFPVVPEGAARLRLQASAALTHEHVEAALEAFARL